MTSDPNDPEIVNILRSYRNTMRFVAVMTTVIFIILILERI